MKASLAHEAPAHSPFGGSVAARVLRCPASVGLVERVPAHLRRSSAYAERGCALHSALALLLDDNGPSLESLVGRTIGDYAITDGDVENSLRPVFTHITALLDAPGTEFYLERRVGFPTIPGAYGTADLLIRIGNTIHVVDLKFGAGVRVTALTPDGDEDVINAQLLFYAAAARHSLREFFAGVETVVLTILQPMSIEADAEMVSSVEVGHAELDGFIAIYRAACEEALSEFPRLARGDWCRFCAARPICPAHTGPLLDLAQTAVPTPANESATPKERKPVPRISISKWGSQVWDRHEDDWYVEPEWCSRRLFEEEIFAGEIWDPAAGLGRVVRSALDMGFPVRASDIVFRQSTDDYLDELKFQTDFFSCDKPTENIVANPPFGIVPPFAEHALNLAARKVALVFPTARLNAAHWLVGMPLRRIWLMTPRPSMPPGHALAAGGKVGGGKTDYCWLIFEQGWTGTADVAWLGRDAPSASVPTAPARTESSVRAALASR